MRQAGVSESPQIVGVRLGWDELPEDVAGEELQLPRRRITGTVRAADRERGPRAFVAPSPADRSARGDARSSIAVPRSVTSRHTSSPVSRQPAPNPVAVEVADRYAKALTLDPRPVAPPQPPPPRRSRAATRDRELRPGAGRRDGDSRAAAGVRDRDSWAAAGRRDAESRAAASTPARPSRGRTPERASAASGRISRPPAPDAAREPERLARSEVDGRATGPRTVTIRGRGAERDLGWSTYESRRRPSTPAHERAGFRPDRVAMWAVFLGLLLVLVAATSSHAAVVANVLH
jgi:hypothetical protein